MFSFPGISVKAVWSDMGDFWRVLYGVVVGVLLALAAFVYVLPRFGLGGEGIVTSQPPGSVEEPTTVRPRMASIDIATQTPVPTRIVATIASPVLVPAPGDAAALSSFENDLAGIYARVAPSVVYITNERYSTATPLDDFPVQGAGSGFAIDEIGDILTNNHVVAGAQRIVVTLQDGATYPAKVVGSDPGNDLAMIKIDVPSGRLPGVSLGDSSRVKPGHIAIAIGNPFGLDRTMTLGIVGSVGRTRSNGIGRPIREMIQIDAAVNPGNSGGPLLNSAGEVIGINTSIESPVRGSVGIGFAVPINTAKVAIPKLLVGSQITHPWIGIRGREVTSDLARQIGLTVDKGVYVVDVIGGGPAESAGLRAAQIVSAESLVPGKGGDVIIAIDGQETARVEDISAYVDTKSVGDTVKLTAIRDGEPVEVGVKLGAWPETSD